MINRKDISLNNLLELADYSAWRIECIVWNEYESGESTINAMFKAADGLICVSTRFLKTKTVKQFFERNQEFKPRHDYITNEDVLNAVENLQKNLARAKELLNR